VGGSKRRGKGGEEEKEGKEKRALRSRNRVSTRQRRKRKELRIRNRVSTRGRRKRKSSQNLGQNIY
jgi:hypothetical protein